MPPDFYFSPGSGQDWLTDGSFGAEGSIICTLVMLASILILAYQLKKSGKLFVKKSAEKPAEAAGVDLQISYYAEFHERIAFCSLRSIDFSRPLLLHNMEKWIVYIRSICSLNSKSFSIFIMIYVSCCCLRRNNAR